MNVGDELHDIQRVFTLRKLPWRSFYFGQNYKVPDSIGVNSFPTYIVLDRDHKIRSVTSQIDYRALDELLTSQ